ncbi:MAG: 50S ribosomal protein L19e [Candidatus Dadabacteria bacterium]|nr:50S ribosomal protein L19e [Candidatus Dadabacteria bacterium]
MSFVKGLKCKECGKEYPKEPLHVCEMCFGPLEAVYKYDEIKEAITKADIKSLIKDKAIRERKTRGISGHRTNRNRLQKSKGRRSGPGSIKGSKHARLSKKSRWINHIRIQRMFLQNLRDKDVIDKSSYRSLYMKSKGGFFRSKRHIKLYIEERNLIKKT